MRIAKPCQHALCRTELGTKQIYHKTDVSSPCYDVSSRLRDEVGKETKPKRLHSTFEHFLSEWHEGHLRKQN